MSDLINKPLFKMDSKGQIRTWQVDIDYDMECLVISHGAVGGEIQTKEEYIDEGKAGRDIGEQLESRAQSRINKKLDSGYVDTIEGAKEPATNLLGLKKPMLAKKSGGNLLKIDWDSAFIQRKYNGHRCLISITENGPVAYSRNGKPIKSICHITCQLADLPVGSIIDGELYKHGVSLQTIGSWVKRNQEESKTLMYHAYDTVQPFPFANRLQWLYNRIEPSDTIVVSETIGIGHIEELNDFFKMFREDGYEGLMLRHGKSGYEDGKRSLSLLKFKAWHDDEFMVVDITESKDGWAVLHFKTRDGKPFSASCPGTMKERRDVWLNKSEYIGFSVNLQYAELTDGGKPFHPVATAWREKGE